MTRRFRFSAAHRLHSALLSDEENLLTYGKCNNPFGHGHDYVGELSASGPTDPVTGRLVPIDDLDRFISDVILEPFDRRNLNTEAAEFAQLVPTTENLALVLSARVSEAWQARFPASSARFEKLRIWETRRNIFEVPAVPR